MSQKKLNPNLNITLDRVLIEYINKNSLLELLVIIKNICQLAHNNQPDFQWNQDADAISMILEKIHN